ncbi:MAG: ferritin family protein [Armatimonadetes bacterium]|nr:ferritin family protein [Armatimonadota bacterium]
MGMNAQELLRQAIQMEIDGREYYLGVAQRTNNPLARHTFETLACEEDRHRSYFEAYYAAAAAGKGWPTMDEVGVDLPDRIQRAETVFSTAAKEASVAPAEGNLAEAYQHALEMERRTIEFYQGLQEAMEDRPVREFLKFIVDQERQHLELLSRSLDVINEPEAWFFDQERWVVEG